MTEGTETQEGGARFLPFILIGLVLAAALVCAVALFIHTRQNGSPIIALPAPVHVAEDAPQPEDYALSNSVTITLGDDERGHGLRHVANEKDGLTVIEAFEGVTSRALRRGANGRTTLYVYFQIDRTFKQNDSSRARFEVDYLDPEPGTMGVQYDALDAENVSNPRYREANTPIQLSGSNTWQKATFRTKGDAVFDNRQNGRSDFRIWANTPLLYVRQVTVTREDAPPQDERQEGNHLQVTVLNEQGQALDGASVRASVRVARGSPSLSEFNRTVTTTAQGVADVLWPPQPFEQLELVISMDDYGARKMVWDLKTGDTIPATYTVKLKSGVQVGGLVVDTEGNPVADATVSLNRYWTGGEERLNKGEETTFPSQKHTTGPDGHWSARSLPPELVHRIFIGATHPDFISVQVSMDGKAEAEKELRAGTYKLALKRGLVVRGRVVNQQQEPIARARVWAGRRFSRERQETRTDADGRFTFRNVNAGKVDFSASADGYAVAAKTHEVSATTEELVFQLVPGSVIGGTVQDESGQPIRGVRVVLEGSPGEESYDRYEFSATTDREGRFEWSSAPNQPMPFYFGKSGYEQKRGVKLKPGEDSVVTLRRNRQILGQVLDAETEKPVTRFTVAIGRSPSPGQFYADSGRAKEFMSAEGRFAVEADEEESNGIQASANGYAEQMQPLPAAEHGQVKVVFKLKPSKPLVGTVVTPDGQPVSGASVALVGDGPGGRTVQFARGNLRAYGSRAKLVTTDASGHFEIQSPPESGTVVAANGTGYGSATVVEIQRSGALTLQVLGRIEGVLMQGAAAGAGQELTLNFPSSGVYFEFESTTQTTDSAGRFTFDKVPAGKVSLVRLVKTSSRSRAHSHRKEVVVAPGQTTQVTLGGTDATLHGQVKFETAPEEKDYLLTAQLSTVLPQPPPDITPEQRAAFYSSAEWKEKTADMKHYAAVIGPDGRLMLDSVEPGQYTLRVTAQKADDESFGAKPLARGEATVMVPQGAQPGTPIQIGEVVLKRAP